MKLLTDAEQRAMGLTTVLMDLIAEEIVGNDASRNPDLSEIAMHIHSIQYMILSQAAARGYPDQYRLLGEIIPAEKG